MKIETNKTLCLFAFLEAATNQQGTSSSYNEFIMSNLGKDENFVKLLNDYLVLNLDYSAKRQEYPDTRHNSIVSKELLWVAASNSNGVDDFKNRIIGVLPNATQANFIRIIKEVEPYYNDLVWEKEQGNIKKMEAQLKPYKNDIASLFLNISIFYNTSWDVNLPFKIMLNPIPLESGTTTAIPMGNALICGFLTKNKNDFKSTLGVAIHEMCHVLYGEQSAKVQLEMEQWFLQSESPYKKLAYNYIDEGLATALGNGWAAEQIGGSLDSTDWYNDVYINGFAKVLYPLVKTYLDDDKRIDQAFVENAIDVFSNRFPDALRQTKILMNEVQLFANTEIESEIDAIVEALHGNFNLRSMWLSTPIDSEQSVEKFGQELTTKLFIVDSEQSETVSILNDQFSSITINTPLNAMDVLFDNESKSALIVLVIDDYAKLKAAMKQLSEIELVEFGRRYMLK